MEILEGEEINFSNGQDPENSCIHYPSYPVTPEELPDWFRDGCKTDLIYDDPWTLSIYLNSHRKDVYSALTLYQTHVSSILAVMLTLFTVITAIFSFATRDTQSNDNFVRNVELMGGMLLILLFFLACISHIILKKYYQVYVSALLQATQVHYWAHITGFSRYELVIQQLSNMKRNLRKNDYIERRTWSRDSNLLYASVIWIMGMLGLLGGLYLLIFTPFSG